MSVVLSDADVIGIVMLDHDSPTRMVSALCGIIKDQQCAYTLAWYPAKLHDYNVSSMSSTVT